jgi:hypothetical protein
MFQIGPSLREARTNRGLSPADVHKAIRIRERYLAALEEEHWEQLPGEAYTKGFLRTYADFLGLNGQLYVDEYNSRFLHGDEEPISPESLARSERPPSGVLLWTLGVLAILGAVAGLAAWRLGGGSSPTTHVQSLAHAAASAPKPTAKAKPAPKPAPSATPRAAVIRAVRGRCWLLVRLNGADGRILYEGTLEQGASKWLPLRTSLWVRLGAPWAVDVRIAGRTFGGLPASPTNVLLSRRGLAPT